MTALEDRLRTELPQLADVLTSTERPEQPILPSSDSELEENTSVLELSIPTNRSSRRWSLVAGAAAAVVAAVALGVVLRDTDERTTVVTKPDAGEVPADSSVGAVTPSTLGIWSVLPEAPIDPRPYAVAAWTGNEAVFWAGSSLSRGFAYSDGAAYDPETDTWRSITVPGWGHPGLTSAFFDGELYALAKGGGSRFDPVNGIWADLPSVTGMFLAATVASDDAIWGLGPAGQNPVGQPDIAIARYQPDTDTWDYGPVFEGTDEQASIVQGLARLESSVHWDGSEIIVWGGSDGGVAFDPANETWRIIDPPEPPSGLAKNSLAAATDAGFTVLVDIDTTQGPLSSVAVLEPDGWRWLDTAIPIENFESVTIAAAPGWLIIFSADESPATVHLPSGAWSSHDDGPLGGVEAPNAVWTGGQLVIWGGVPNDTASPEGASWTPPTP